MAQTNGFWLLGFCGDFSIIHSVDIYGQALVMVKMQGRWQVLVVLVQEYSWGLYIDKCFNEKE